MVPRTLHIQAPLDVLPMYVRANAPIPTTEPASFTTEEPFREITVEAYLFERGGCELYDTDGLTFLAAEIHDTQLHVALERLVRRARRREGPGYVRWMGLCWPSSMNR